MKRFLTIASLLVFTTINVFAQDSPLWIRQNSISPDGTQIAFSYKGDIYTVSSEGGKATQITSNSAYDSEPMWTSDSKNIVFISYREGSKDIFITSTEGGSPKRITELAGNETPMAVLPDGKIVFSAWNHSLMSHNYNDFPGRQQLFVTDINGATPELISSFPMLAISVNEDGVILYEDFKSVEDGLRKHHTSSAARDIWKYTPPAGEKGFGVSPEGNFTKLTTYEGEDRNPVFAADGNTFYYLSEQNGTNINVFRSSLSNPSETVQLTFAEKDPVRFLSVADNGTIAYSFNGELYTIKPGGKAEKVEISITRDDSEQDLVKRQISSGVTALAVSPNGKEVAIVARGDVYVTSVDYRTTRRITNTAEQERNVEFSPDGRELYYSAERNGCWSIYRSVLTDKDDDYFTYAVNIKEEIVSTPGETCFQPKVSPDGKWVAYYRNREDLVIKNLKNGEVKTLFEDINYSYSDGDQNFEWSPDSHYILCNWQANGGWNNEDVALVDIETGSITNLTQSGYSDSNFKWALGGKAMVWESDKNGYRSHGSWGADGDIYIMFFDNKAMIDFNLSKEEAELAKLSMSDKEKKKEEKAEKKDSLDNKVKKLELNLKDREDKIQRLTSFSNSIGDHYLTPNGKELYFIQRLESGADLCVLNIQEGGVRVLKKGVSGRIIPSQDGQFIYILSNSGISRITLANGATKAISFSGEFDYRPKEERAYMFEHIWKQVKEKFYVSDLHGVDWDYYHDNYARFLPHINNNFDFQDLLSEMLGELNGSHTGGRYRHPSSVNMGYLGAIYDHTYEGDGLMIKEILPGGVLYYADDEIKAGDIITSVEGQKILAGDNWMKLFTNKGGKKISITVKKGKKEFELFVTPVTSEADLLYKRWVKQREEMVEELSGGRVGYVHIEGMDSPSFRELYSKALGKYRNCEALIVDTRHNGGGWLHDDIVTFLGGTLYNQYIPRERFIGNEPFSKWTKPSCMLVSENNYSDASGTPFAYRALGLGKLIGAPIPGTMTAVWWETLIDNTLVFGIPQVGTWAVEDKHYIENTDIDPDIVVYNTPESVLEGRDLQLEAAVEEMLKEIDKK